MRVTAFFTCILTALVALPIRASEKSFDSNGVKIHYLDQGKGEVVVLLHGFSGTASETWEKRLGAKTQILPSLAREYRVIAPDFRGHGKSDKPHDCTKCGIDLAEDVIRLLNHLKIEKAHVVGYSMGATVAGKLLVTHPDRLISVTFGGGGPAFRLSKEFNDLMNATAESLEQNKGLGPLVTAMIPAGGPKLSPGIAEVMGKLALGNNDQKVLAAVIRGQKELIVTEEQLKANKVPVQFVHGSQESGLVKERVAAAQEVLPKATFLVIEKYDHRSTVGCPEFHTAVLKFLRNHSR